MSDTGALIVVFVCCAAAALLIGCSVVNWLKQRQGR
jgi:hypothetical protein